MAWIYFTSISPNNNSYEEAFEYFLKQCIIDVEKLYKHLNDNNYYRFLIKTEDSDNVIITKDKKIFYKSKFLASKNFKKALVEYYKPLNIYVKGPIEILRKDEKITNRWIIDLSFIK